MLTIPPRVLEELSLPITDPGPIVRGIINQRATSLAMGSCNWNFNLPKSLETCNYPGA